MYVLVFHPNSCGYRCHLKGCSASTDQPDADGNARRHAFSTPFDTIAAARAFANADESEKAGEPVKANFRVCTCAA